MQTKSPTSIGDIEATESGNVSNPENISIIVAAFRGAIEEDVNYKGKKIIALKKLLQNGWPNKELKQTIIASLLELESIREQCISNKAAVIKFLIQKGAETGNVLLSRTIDFETIKAIGEGGGNLKYSHVGCTALHTTILNCFNLKWREQLKYLLENGVDPNKTTECMDLTALHIAIANEIFGIDGKYNKAKYLIGLLSQFNYDWNIPESEGKTPIIVAANTRSSELVMQLVAKKNTDKANINLDRQDNKGRTALHFSCALGDLESAKALLDAGASIEIPDSQGKLAFDYTMLNEALIRNILEEIAIDPERDEYAINDYIVGTDHTPVTVRKKGNSSNFLARKDDWDKFGEKLLTRIKTDRYQKEEWRKYDLKFFKMQGHFSGKPLSQACIQGQQEVRNYFMAHIAKEPIDYAKLIQRTNQAFKYDLNLKSFLTLIEAKKFPTALREVSPKGKNYLAATLIAYIVSSNLSIKDSINNTSMNGKTTLHWAAESANKTKDESLIKLLLTYDPDTTLSDKQGNLYSAYLDEEMLKKILPDLPSEQNEETVENIAKNVTTQQNG